MDLCWYKKENKMKYFTAKAANKVAKQTEIGVDLCYDDNMQLIEVLDIIKERAKHGYYSHQLYNRDYSEPVLNELSLLGYEFKQDYNYDRKEFYDLEISW